jgi:8-oxo-dGTP diphosphatase
MNHVLVEVVRNTKSVMGSSQKISREEFCRNFPRKRNGACVVVVNEDGKYLAVKPSYRDDGWMIPGGIVEEGEAPWSAVEREISEELGLSFSNLQLVLLGYFQEEEPCGDLFVFMFEKTPLTALEEASVEIGDLEISRFAWFSQEELLKALMPSHKHMFGAYIKKKDEAGIVLLENGEIVSQDMS